MNRILDIWNFILTNKRIGQRAIIMVSKTIYNNMDETSYLLRSSNNAARLMASIEDYKCGKVQERTLIEE